MTNRQQEMIEYTIQEVVRYIMEDEGVAMEQFYMSEVFDKLNDIETGLYLEGSAYIYEMLKREKHFRGDIQNSYDYSGTDKK